MVGYNLWYTLGRKFVVLEPVFIVASLSRNALILEDRSAAYIDDCEQRTVENQCISARSRL